MSSFFPLKAFLFIRFYLNYRNNTVPFACPNYKHAPLKNTQFVCGVNCIVPFSVKILPGFSALAESILCQMVHILVSLCFVFGKILLFHLGENSHQIFDTKGKRSLLITRAPGS